MERIKGYIEDIVKVTIIASMVSLALSLVISSIGLLIYGFDAIKILESVRMFLFMIGSLGLLLGALFVIKKKNNELLKHEREWKAKFREFNFVTVLLMFSSLVLFYGIIFDFMLYNL
jgi:integral membrane sensor domain MASE1